MINEREHRILEDIERRMTAEDPALVLRLSGSDEWARWRLAWRRGMSVPVLVLVVMLSATGFALQISSLGVVFLLWGPRRWGATAGPGRSRARLTTAAPGYARARERGGNEAATSTDPAATTRWPRL
jgi:Protein of unknown function (DUF3040)